LLIVSGEWLIGIIPRFTLLLDIY